MKTPKPTGFFARMWGWLCGVFRPKPSPSKLLDGFVEATAPIVPPAMAQRIDNSLLAPVRPRLKPSMVPTTKLPSAEPSVEQTTKVPTPPEPQTLLSAPERKQAEAPTPRREAPRVLSLDDPHLVRPPSPKMSKIVLPTKAEKALLEGNPTTQFHAPRQVKKEKSPSLTQVELAIESMPDGDEWEEPRNVVVADSQTMPAPVLPADMAPPTLVQPRVQDNPELLDLIEEFNARYGES
jgi:hypothetical protein